MRTVAPLTINNTQWTGYTPTPGTKKIAFRETAAAGTANVLVAMPTTADGPYTLLPGEQLPLEAYGNFSGGTIWLKSSASSFTIDILEIA